MPVFSAIARAFSCVIYTHRTAAQEALREIKDE